MFGQVLFEGHPVLDAVVASKGDLSHRSARSDARGEFKFLGLHRSSDEEDFAFAELFADWRGRDASLQLEADKESEFDEEILPGRVQPARQLSLFDGLVAIQDNQFIDEDITGLLVPATGFDATLGVVAYEGDAAHTGDQIFFNDLVNPLTHGTGTDNNFFDSSHTDDQGPVSTLGDLPQLTGQSNSEGSYDLHTLDVTNRVAGGSTSAKVRIVSTAESYLLGAVVTSIAVLSPVLTDTQKTFIDLNGGDIRLGDVLEFDV